MSASFGKRLSFCTWVQFRHLPEGGDTDRGAAGPQRQPLNRRELRRRMAPRSSGSAAPARQAGGRAQIIPFRMCRQAAATDSDPRA